LSPIHIYKYDMDTHSILPRLISGILSVLDATNLRNRAYRAELRVEALELAIEDIERINASEVDEAERARLIAGICERVQSSER